MLNWIPAFFEKATAWCPRMLLIAPTHRLVKWSKCGEPTLRGPGLEWYWPLVTEVEIVDTRWVTSLMYTQSITMSDGTTVSAKALTVWRVSDPVRCESTNQDGADRAGELTMAAVASVLATGTKKDLKKIANLNLSLTEKTRALLSECGIEVQECRFTELVISPAVRLIQETNE